MTLEQEIELLKAKVALLGRIKELQEAIDKIECQPVYVPYPVSPLYPYNPSWPVVTYRTGTAGG